MIEMALDLVAWVYHGFEVAIFITDGDGPLGWGMSPLSAFSSSSLSASSDSFSLTSNRPLLAIESVRRCHSLKGGLCRLLLPLASRLRGWRHGCFLTVIVGARTSPVSFDPNENISSSIEERFYIGITRVYDGSHPAKIVE